MTFGRAANPTATSVAVVVSVTPNDSQTRMRICYIDEAGDTISLKSPTSESTPILVLAAIVINKRDLLPLTIDFLNLKSRYFPELMHGIRPLHRILIEIKGSEIRRSIRSKNRKALRHSLGFLDRIFELLETYQVRIFARVLVKGIGNKINGVDVYTSYMQAICTCFQQYLNSENTNGLVIADGRLPYENERVSHSIFTQKFKLNGDVYDRILEMPTFGHSTNHIGIQLADIVSSALLFPIASHTYCAGHVKNVHVHENFALLKDRYKERLKAIQYRYTDESGKYRGGITVADEIGKRSSSLMFR